MSKTKSEMNFVKEEIKKCIDNIESLETDNAKINETINTLKELIQPNITENVDTFDREGREILKEVLQTTILFIRELSTSVLPLGINELNEEEREEIEKRAEQRTPDKKKIKISAKQYGNLLEYKYAFEILNEKVSKKQSPNTNTNLLFTLADSIHNLPDALYHNEKMRAGADLEIFKENVERLLYKNEQTDFARCENFSFFKSNHKKLKERIENKFYT